MRTESIKTKGNRPASAMRVIAGWSDEPVVLG
jgi:hypothetical protein